MQGALGGGQSDAPNCHHLVPYSATAANMEALSGQSVIAQALRWLSDQIAIGQDARRPPTLDTKAARGVALLAPRRLVCGRHEGCCTESDLKQRREMTRGTVRTSRLPPGRRRMACALVGVVAERNVLRSSTICSRIARWRWTTARFSPRPAALGTATLLLAGRVGGGAVQPRLGDRHRLPQPAYPGNPLIPSHQLRAAACIPTQPRRSPPRADFPRFPPATAVRSSR